MKTTAMCLLALAVYPAALSSTPNPVSWFSTGGETIYHLKGARTSAEVPRSIVAAAYSGEVLCFDLAGKKL